MTNKTKLARAQLIKDNLSRQLPLHQALENDRVNYTVEDPDCYAIITVVYDLIKDYYPEYIRCLNKNECLIPFEDQIKIMDHTFKIIKNRAFT